MSTWWRIVGETVAQHECDILGCICMMEEFGRVV